MQYWEDVSQVPADWPASVVAIGVFDGVHRGHRELVRTAIGYAARSGMPCVILTFDPSPVEVVGFGDPPTRVSTLRQRVELLEKLGVDAVAVLQFTEEVAQQPAEQFAGSVLSDQLHAGVVVVGDNFRFGHRARGDTTLLSELGRDLGFDVVAVHLMSVDNDHAALSSSVIRGLVAAGDVAAAARCLARPHRVEGEVVRGDGRGSQLGFPTANVDFTPNAAIPGDGVYAGRLVLDPYGPGHQVLPAAISVGTNPTFDGAERRVEAFAYDADDLDLYGRYVALDFVAKIREQQKFADEQELIVAVERDVDHARVLLGG